MKKYLTVVCLLTASLVVPSIAQASFAPIPDPPNVARAASFARSRLHVAHQIKEWEHRKEQRRQRIHDRRVAQAAAEAAAQAASAPTTPTPTPSTSSFSSSSTPWQISESELVSLLRQAGFPESVIPTMVYIARRESNLCPTAVYGYGCAGSGHAYNGGPACGLFQLYHCPGPQALDPATNVAYAYQKYRASGLSPWGM